MNNSNSFIFIPEFDDLDDISESKSEISIINFHTGLALLFITGPELSKNKKDHILFKNALIKLDELGYETTFEKLSHRLPLKITSSAIRLYAKELLDNS